MQMFIGALLGFILGVVLAIGAFIGVNTSGLEDYAAMYGIEPMELPFLDSGLDMLGSEEGDFATWDDAEFETSWTAAETALDCAEGAGVETFPDMGAIEFGHGVPAVYYYFEDGHAQAICLYDDITAVFIDKAVYGGVDDITSDDRAYEQEWTITLDGVEVECYGFEDGVVNKAIFNDGEYVYGIQVYGPDSDVDRGLTEAEFEMLLAEML